MMKRILFLISLLLFFYQICELAAFQVTSTTKKDSLYFNSDTLYFYSPLTEQNIIDITEFGLKYTNQINDSIKVITFLYDLLPSMDEFMKLQTISMIDKKMIGVDNVYDKTIRKLLNILRKFLEQSLNENKTISKSTMDKLDHLLHLTNNLTHYSMSFKINYLKYKWQLVFLYHFSPEQLGLSEQKNTKKK